MDATSHTTRPPYRYRGFLIERENANLFTIRFRKSGNYAGEALTMYHARAAADFICDMRALEKAEARRNHVSAVLPDFELFDDEDDDENAA